jgi:hypothetical protein
MMPNKCIKPARFACLTRKSLRDLLAAYARALGVMKSVGSIDELSAFDSSEAFPKFEASRLENLQRAMARLKRQFRVQLILEDPSGFQDGSLFTHAREELQTAGNRDHRGGYYFSKFGLLFSGGRMSEMSSGSMGTWSEMTRILSDDYGLLFVPDELLSQPYNGMFVAYRCSTWGESFFSAFYHRRPTMPPTRRAKTQAREG